MSFAFEFWDFSARDLLRTANAVGCGAFCKSVGFYAAKEK